MTDRANRPDSRVISAKRNEKNDENKTVKCYEWRRNGIDPNIHRGKQSKAQNENVIMRLSLFENHIIKLREICDMICYATL